MDKIKEIGLTLLLKNKRFQDWYYAKLRQEYLKNLWINKIDINYNPNCNCIHCKTRRNNDKG